MLNILHTNHSISADERMYQACQLRLHKLLAELMLISTDIYTLFIGRFNFEFALSDEPRIRLAEGDVVRVTRWKKYVAKEHFHLLFIFTRRAENGTFILIGSPALILLFL